MYKPNKLNRIAILLLSIFSIGGFLYSNTYALTNPTWENCELSKIGDTLDLCGLGSNNYIKANLTTNNNKITANFDSGLEYGDYLSIELTDSDGQVHNIGQQVMYSGDTLIDIDLTSYNISEGPFYLSGTLISMTGGVIIPSATMTGGLKDTISPYIISSGEIEYSSGTYQLKYYSSFDTNTLNSRLYIGTVNGSQISIENSNPTVIDSNIVNNFDGINLSITDGQFYYYFIRSFDKLGNYTDSDVKSYVKLCAQYAPPSQEMEEQCTSSGGTMTVNQDEFGCYLPPECIINTNTGTISQDYSCTVSGFCSYTLALANSGYIDLQTSEGLYGLDSNMSRQDMLKLMVKMRGITVTDFSCKGYFNDITNNAPNDWICGYAETAVDNNLIGTGTNFRPEDNITKIEALQMILNGAGIQISTGRTSSFDDVSEQWQIDVTETALEHQIISPNQSFNPNYEITKGEIYVITANALNINDDVNLDDIFGSGTTTTTGSVINIINAPEFLASDRHSITVSWNNIPEASGYIIRYYPTNTIFADEYFYTTSNTNSVTIEGLSPSQTYTIQVVAYSGDAPVFSGEANIINESSYSEYSIYTTNGLYVEKPKVDMKGENNIVLFWDDIPEASGYAIHYTDLNEYNYCFANGYETCGLYSEITSNTGITINYLIPGDNYEIRLHLVDENGFITNESSNSIIVRTPQGRQGVNKNEEVYFYGPYKIEGVRGSSRLTLSGAGLEVSVNGEEYISGSDVIVKRGDELNFRTISSSEDSGIKTDHIIFSNDLQYGYDFDYSDLNFSLTTVTKGAGDPDYFRFGYKNYQEPNSVIYSDSIYINGISGSGTSTIGIQDGEYSINGSEWTSQTGIVSNGDFVTIKATTGNGYNINGSSILTIGNISGEFYYTTKYSEGTPDSFEIETYKNANPGELVYSKPIFVEGIKSSTGAELSIMSGEYYIYRFNDEEYNNTHDYTSNTGTVKNGDIVYIRTTASEEYTGHTYASIELGGIWQTFNIYTKSEYDPDNFYIGEFYSKDINEMIYTYPIRVSGIKNGSADLTVGYGVEYSINGGEWSNEDTIVYNSDFIYFRKMSPSEYDTTNFAYVKIGNVYADFNISTRGELDDIFGYDYNYDFYDGYSYGYADLLTGEQEVGSGEELDLSDLFLNINSTGSNIEYSGALILKGIDSIYSTGNTFTGILKAPEKVLSGATENATTFELSSLVGSGNEANVLDTIKVGGEKGQTIFASGGYFYISTYVSNSSSGDTINIFRSSDGNIWEANYPDATCKIDFTKMCNFKTNHLTYFAPTKITTKNNNITTTPTNPIISSQNTGNSGGGGGGGGGATMDFCPNGDTSTSYYDGKCNNDSKTISDILSKTSEVTKKKITIGEKINQVSDGLNSFIKVKSGKNLKLKEQYILKIKRLIKQRISAASNDKTKKILTMILNNVGKN